MLHFSEKEYDYLKREVSEIRSYITRIIGFILTVAGLSVSLIEAFMETQKPLKELAIIGVAVAIITFLFELAWYKFKSHNRYTGYIQLITQEVDFITKERAEKDPDKFKSKDYVKNYDEYIYEGTKEEDPNKKYKKLNLTSWEFIMSRLNSSSALKKNNNSSIEKQKLKKAVTKSMFVFKLPDGYKYKFIDNYDNLDIKFSDKITYDLYRNNKSKDSESQDNNPKGYSIDKRYTTVGWGYPRLITWIAFTAISILLISFISVFVSEFKPISLSDAGFKDFLPPVLLTLVVLTYCWWIVRYLLGLKELSSGRYSIDGYCWTFFIFRVQLLNSRGIIPIYFSRSFVRFFKNQLILQDLNKDEVKDYVKYNYPKIHLCTKNCDSDQKNEPCNTWNEYKDRLSSFCQISDKKQRKVHEAFNEAVKVKRKIIDNPFESRKNKND